MTAAVYSPDNPSPQEYKRRIWAWTMYDWANSAFATTILAAVLPIYFSQVAGATLPSATVATAYWSTGLSLSLFIIAVIAPVLGTISDLMRGKKRFLSLFAGIGIVSTSLLVLVGTGDWILASILGIIGRIGFSGANTFYDALLPKPDFAVLFQLYHSTYRLYSVRCLHRARDKRSSASHFRIFHIDNFRAWKLCFSFFGTINF